MPISKDGNLYFTEKQYEKARHQASAFLYAKAQGYKLVKINDDLWTLPEYETMRFSEKTGLWFWNDKGISGSAIEFAMYFEGKSIVEAVLAITENGKMKYKQHIGRSKYEEKSQHQKFQFPPKADTTKHLWAYLYNSRGLERDVVQYMLDTKLIYESQSIFGNTKLRNCTFIFHAPDGSVVGAFNRGMLPVLDSQHKSYKRLTFGSNTEYGWVMPSPTGNTKTLCVFKSAMDAASYASLNAIALGQDWRRTSITRLSLEGYGTIPVLRFLEVCTSVCKVIIMLDSSENGKRTAQDMEKKLKNNYPNLLISIKFPPKDGQDWNDALLEYRKTTIVKNDTPGLSS